ncbi:diacylglycerol kinase family protein [Mucilaginibacter limnophilus]|uniref:Diacylglycerol kinase family protein n=1 Tax=Mucilaginibacter limnophilus TaxID=1932778 RepID=A0A437MZ96_9SPHI|nr:diacylglycerol kinase family protein [Mucilaginibacter limnophilus]RVU03010.1 diacylglycerol kinase family protein [Mucilaginibacter limnophilus]
MNKFRKHLVSYRYAVKGIALAFRFESNMLFHLAAAIFVILVNLLLHITKTEWLITLMLIGLVWTAELFNTAIEKLADRITKEEDGIIGQVKDLASGAVLIICGFSVLCAAIIYLPYLF